MTREKLEITAKKCPYWKRIKEKTKSGLNNVAYRVAYVLAVCMGTKDLDYLDRQETDEGFYPEVHENKNQIRRY